MAHQAVVMSPFGYTCVNIRLAGRFAVLRDDAAVSSLLFAAMRKKTFYRGSDVISWQVCYARAGGVV